MGVVLDRAHQRHFPRFNLDRTLPRHHTMAKVVLPYIYCERLNHEIQQSYRATSWRLNQLAESSTKIGQAVPPLFASRLLIEGTQNWYLSPQRWLNETPGSVPVRRGPRPLGSSDLLCRPKRTCLSVMREIGGLADRWIVLGSKLKVQSLFSVPACRFQ